MDDISYEISQDIIDRGREVNIPIPADIKINFTPLPPIAISTTIKTFDFAGYEEFGEETLPIFLEQPK